MPVFVNAPPQYATQMVVALGTDSVFPISQSTLRSNIDAMAVQVRQWFWDECDQFTFKVAPTLLFNHGITEKQVWDMAGPTGSNGFTLLSWSLEQMDIAGAIHKVSPRRYYSWLFPSEVGGLGGMFGAQYFGANHVFPGVIAGGIGLLGQTFSLSTVATAPSPATSGTTLSLPSGMGVRFARYTVPFNIRIWAPYPAVPTAAGFEVATVVGRTNDQLSLVRAVGTPARTIGVGDQVKREVADIGSDALTDSLGGMAHELGHGFGGTYWNPRVSQGQPHSISQGHFGRRDGQGVYEALPHPPDVYAGYGSDGVLSVMQHWWEFPNVTFLPQERERLKRSPFVTFQSNRPTTLDD